MDTIKAMQTPIFFFKATQRYELFLCYFFLLYFVKKKKNLFYSFSCIFKKIIFVHKPIKKLAIIEIILLNVTHLSLIFLYCLIIYILFLFFSIILSSESSNSLIFFSLSEILISEFLSFFLQYLKLSDKFFVNNCMFKQYILHQIVTQIEVIQEQIMQ